MSDSEKKSAEPVPAERHTAGRHANTRRNDEIDLLDLFLVLVRYRKLILGLTAAAIGIAVLGYFFYPAYQYRQAVEKSIPEARLQVMENEILGVSSENYNLQAIFMRPELVLKALQQAGYAEYQFYGNVAADLQDAEDQPRALYLIEQRLIKNQNTDEEPLPERSRLFAVRESKNGVELAFKNEDTEKARIFVEALYQLGNEVMEQKLKASMETITAAHEQLLAIENPGENLAQRIVAEQQRYDQAKKILSGEESILIRSGNAYSMQPEISLDSFRDDFKIKAVVLVAAVFLISIFLAFVLNLVSNIRNDEESMRKIRKALNKE